MDSLRNDSSLFVLPKHCVGLATAGLPIRKNGTIVSINKAWHHLFRSCLINHFLRSIGTKYFLKSIATVVVDAELLIIKYIYSNISIVDNFVIQQLVFSQRLKPDICFYIAFNETAVRALSRKTHWGWGRCGVEFIYFSIPKAICEAFSEIILLIAGLALMWWSR